MATPQIHQDIGTGKQEVKPIQVLLQPSVGHLLVAEITLHNEKNVLRLAADRGLVVLNLLSQLIPV